MSRPLAQHDDRGDLLAHRVIRKPDHGRQQHAMVFGQHRLDVRVIPDADAASIRDGARR